MIAPKAVLVATDFGEASRQAAVYGAEFARVFHADLHIVHVVDDLALSAAANISAPPIDLASVQATLEDEGRRQLEVLTSANDMLGVPIIRNVLRDTQPGRAIVAYANAHAIDLMVIGTHGRTGLANFFLGSVAQRLVRTAPCPVLTVRAQPHELATA